MNYLVRLVALLIAVVVATSACSTIQSFLPPQPCIVSSDLPVSKSVKPVPEVATTNDEFYLLFAHERAEHAKDDQDYNSLYSQCVGVTAK